MTGPTEVLPRRRTRWAACGSCAAAVPVVRATADVGAGRQADQEPLRRGVASMKPNGHRRPGAVRPRAARCGLWRAVAAAPAMLGSLLLVMLASVAVGRWAGLPPLTWAVAAAVLMTRVGQRMAVRAVCVH